ncbi:hypothetical protein C0Q70_19975 [Pomacea canaliculata]|uniref:Uncharacterized protein n=1 Tax=Pomacea canaliculata TaxID=400727 RepID=A0A2T7NE97_POMCA|nr:hypothetical protein C0Q70_19975 [Pomacea canaliculata]
MAGSQGVHEYYGHDGPTVVNGNTTLMFYEPTVCTVCPWSYSCLGGTRAARDLPPFPSPYRIKTKKHSRTRWEGGTESGGDGGGGGGGKGNAEERKSYKLPSPTQKPHLELNPRGYIPEIDTRERTQGTIFTLIYGAQRVFFPLCSLDGNPPLAALTPALSPPPHPHTHHPATLPLLTLPQHCSHQACKIKAHKCVSSGNKWSSDVIHPFDGQACHPTRLHFTDHTHTVPRVRYGPPTIITQD